MASSARLRWLALLMRSGVAMTTVQRETGERLTTSSAVLTICGTAGSLKTTLAAADLDLHELGGAPAQSRPIGCPKGVRHAKCEGEDPSALELSIDHLHHGAGRADCFGFDLLTAGCPESQMA